MPRRRRNRVGPFVIDIMFAILAIVLFFAFLNSGLWVQMGQQAASQLHFGPTPPVVPSP